MAFFAKPEKAEGDDVSIAKMEFKENRYTRHLIHWLEHNRKVNVDYLLRAAVESSDARVRELATKIVVTDTVLEVIRG